MVTFNELLAGTRGDHGIPAAAWRLLALDPGLTTGFAVFQGQRLVHAGQIRGEHSEIQRLFDVIHPSVVVCEDYRVYAWRAKHHANSSLQTTRLIGGVELLCVQHGIPLTLQAAQQAKSFCTDSKLKDWDFYRPNRPHATDAIRHGCYYLLFHGATTTLKHRATRRTNVG